MGLTFFSALTAGKTVGCVDLRSDVVGGDARVAAADIDDKDAEEEAAVGWDGVETTTNRFKCNTNTAGRFASLNVHHADVHLQLVVPGHMSSTWRGRK